MMQNVNTPALDLIVRESLQNSLDASLPNVDKIPVKFIYNDFDVDKLSKEFDEELMKYKVNKEKIMAINSCQSLIQIQKALLGT